MSPAGTLQVLDRYSLVVLPALVVAEQFGIPLPAVPALLGFGALVAHGRGRIPVMLGTLAIVALTVDFAWYEFGRRRGARVLTGLLYDLAGVLLWAGLWIGVGYSFSDAVAVIAVRVAAVGLRLGSVLGALLGGYILIKYLRRRLYLRRLRTASISAEGLKVRLDAGENITIVDLRTALEVAAVPHAIPGSLWVEADHIDRHEAEILRDRDLILYCS